MTTTPTAYLVVVGIPSATGQPWGPPVGGPRIGQSFQLTAGSNLFARNAPTQATSTTIINLAWPFVSRQHAQIELNALGQWEIEDLQSRNGTYINGQQLQPHHRQVLKVGDQISIGSGYDAIVLEFCLQVHPSAVHGDENDDWPVPLVVPAREPGSESTHYRP
jgi:pSer/pThr/pTyr-binding forkhead associated (FHA) protein